MDIFEQTKTSDIPYVDWMNDDSRASGLGFSPSLPWEPGGVADAGEKRASRRGRGGVPWSKSFLKRAGGGLPDPVGAFWKFVSLVIIPALFTATAYLLFRGFLQWSEYPSLAVLLLVFILVLKRSASRLDDRPSFLDVLKFFCQEAALVWLMWIFGSLFYTLSKHNLGILAFDFVNTFVGLVAAGITYFFAAKRVARRKGARKTLRYLLQVVSVIAMNFAGTVAGYFLAPMFWQLTMSADCPPHGNYVVAMLSAFVTLWIAVHQFYIEAGNPNRSTSRRERGTDMDID
jgi:hypothetical protein